MEAENWKGFRGHCGQGSKQAAGVQSQAAKAVKWQRDRSKTLDGLGCTWGARELCCWRAQSLGAAELQGCRGGGQAQRQASDEGPRGWKKCMRMGVTQRQGTGWRSVW